MDNRFKMIAKTFRGLEDVLFNELENIGATDLVKGNRMVEFTGDKKMMYRANFHLRTALRILKPIKVILNYMIKFDQLTGVNILK